MKENLENETIMTRAEEVKEAASICLENVTCQENCPFYEDFAKCSQIHTDVTALIEALQARVLELEAGHRTEFCEDRGMECCELGKVRAELEDVRRERDAAVEVIDGFMKVGYPHNFQCEALHIVSYMNDITAAMRKAFRWRGPQEGRE